MIAEMIAAAFHLDHHVSDIRAEVPASPGDHRSQNRAEVDRQRQRSETLLGLQIRIVQEQKRDRIAGQSPLTFEVALDHRIVVVGVDEQRV